MSDQLTVEWGDCAEAGIVFYPNYFYWFDCAFHRLLRSRGLSQREIKRRFGAVTPIVKADADFLAPARYDDVLSVEARITEWSERRFRVSYTMRHAERIAVNGFEVRAWALVDGDGRIKGAPIEPVFRQLMEITE